LTLAEFIKINDIWTAVYKDGGRKRFYMKAGRGEGGRIMQQTNWTRGKVSAHDRLMELGEMVISVNLDVPYPDPVPEMDFATWMAIPFPVAGRERTEELYKECFSAEAALVNFCCASWDYLEPYRELLKIIQSELDLKPKTIEELLE
jgi:hypothetical protein